MSNVIYAWTLNLKGAVFVTSLRPLQIVIAVAMGVVFLNDTLYIGRYDTTILLLLLSLHNPNLKMEQCRVGSFLGNFLDDL